MNSRVRIDEYREAVDIKYVLHHYYQQYLAQFPEEVRNDILTWSNLSALDLMIMRSPDHAAVIFDFDISIQAEDESDDLSNDEKQAISDKTSTQENVIGKAIRERLLDVIAFYLIKGASLIPDAIRIELAINHHQDHWTGLSIELRELQLDEGVSFALSDYAEIYQDLFRYASNDEKALYQAMNDARNFLIDTFHLKNDPDGLINCFQQKFALHMDSFGKEAYFKEDVAPQMQIPSIDVKQIECSVQQAHTCADNTAINLFCLAMGMEAPPIIYGDFSKRLRNVMDSFSYEDKNVRNKEIYLCTLPPEELADCYFLLANNIPGQHQFDLFYKGADGVLQKMNLPPKKLDAIFVDIITEFQTIIMDESHLLPIKVNLSQDKCKMVEDALDKLITSTIACEPSKINAEMTSLLNEVKLSSTISEASMIESSDDKDNDVLGHTSSPLTLEKPGQSEIADLLKQVRDATTISSFITAFRAVVSHSYWDKRGVLFWSNKVPDTIEGMRHYLDDASMDDDKLFGKIREEFANKRKHLFRRSDVEELYEIIADKVNVLQSAAVTPSSSRVKKK